MKKQMAISQFQHFVKKAATDAVRAELQHVRLAAAKSCNKRERKYLAMQMSILCRELMYRGIKPANI